MPTEDEILVPETLLKKRKSQEKQREERSAELEKKKKVRQQFPHFRTCSAMADDDDIPNCVTKPLG